MGTSAGSGNFSWSGLAYRTAGGAFMGSFLGYGGIANYYKATRLGAGLGYGYGYGSRHRWW